MQFSQRTPDEEVNYSRENPLREALLLVGVVAAVIAAILFGGAWVAEELAVRMPPKWEARLFGFMARSFEGTESDPRVERVSELLTHLTPTLPKASRSECSTTTSLMPSPPQAD